MKISFFYKDHICNYHTKTKTNNQIFKLSLSMGRIGLNTISTRFQSIITEEIATLASFTELLRVTLSDMETEFGTFG